MGNEQALTARGEGVWHQSSAFLILHCTVLSLRFSKLVRNKKVRAPSAPNAMGKPFVLRESVKDLILLMRTLYGLFALIF